MVAIVKQHNEMGQFLGMLERHGYVVYGRKNNSLSPASDTQGFQTLPQFVSGARHGTLQDLPERVRRIQNIANDMVGNLEAGVSVKRHQIWSRAGHTVSVHKVLGGHLGTAWKKSVAAHVRSRNLTIVVPSAVPFTVSTEHRFYQVAATCALAAHAAQRGMHVNVWGMHMHARPFEDSDTSVITLVHLLSSSEPWSLSRLALMTYNEWPRRLMWRALELLQPVYGPVRDSYGPPGNAADMLKWLRSEWAKAQRLDPDSIILGCTYADHVVDAASALAWAQTYLASMDSARTMSHA